MKQILDISDSQEINQMKTTIITAAIALAVAPPASAQPLPKEFQGKWHTTQSNSIPVTTDITAIGFHEPGYHCNIKGVKSSRDRSGDVPIYQVDMRCTEEGPPPFDVKTIWAIRRLTSGEVLVITTLPDRALAAPSIEVFQRGEQ
jgi:hypothetical protein